MDSQRSFRALIFGAPNPLSMGLAWIWLRAGHSIIEIWHPQRDIGSSDYSRDQRLALQAPHMSMQGLANGRAIKVRPIAKLSDWSEALETAQSLQPDVIISLMFMDRIPASFIGAFKGRIVNMHPSLLPAYRGPSPFLEMLWHRSFAKVSGLTLHEVTEGFDEGPIIDQLPVPFPASGNFGQYIADQVRVGGRLLVETLPKYLGGIIIPKPQQHSGASYCTVKKPDLVIAPSDGVERVKWLLGTIGKFSTFRIADQAADLRVDRLEKVLGRPNGSAANVTEQFVEMDIADARVRLGRHVALVRPTSRRPTPPVLWASNQKPKRLF
jgi:methionyl-tRNA formyltransferase